MMKRLLPATAIAALLALGACTTSAPSSSVSANMGYTFVTPGTLTVCTNVPFQPMEFKDDSGTIVGFDIDLMGLVATKMGVAVTPVEVDFDQLASGAALAAKKCDIGAASITITTQRQQAVNFSVPYFAATQALAAKTDSGINGLGDLSGKKVAVQTGTTGADFANANADQYGFEVVTFDDASAALTNILTGRVDACIIDRAVVYGFVDANTTTHVATEFQTGEQYGFATAKDDNGQALANVVNDVLTSADADGTYLSLYKKWIDPNATSANLPG